MDYDHPFPRVLGSVGSVFIKNKGICANKWYLMGGYYFVFNVFFEGLILHDFLICVIKVGACCKFNFWVKLFIIPYITYNEMLEIFSPYSL